MWKLQTLLYSFLIPKEFSILIGALSLSPYRILLILFTPWIIKQIVVKHRFKWRPLDTFALFVCIWPAVALTFNTDFYTAIESGGIIFLETFVPFFLARLTVYNHQRLIKISKTLLIVASSMAVVALPEAITGTPYAHNIASWLTGGSFTHTPESRLGIWRAMGTSDHPIILGSICAAALPLGFALFRRGTVFISMTGLSFLGVIASVSSGPILSIVAQLSLYVWSVFTRGVKSKWWKLILLIASLYILIDIASNRDPFRVMFSYLLFNEHNGYVRYSMWANSLFLAGQSIQSFMVGYGFSTDMMSLLDNAFWTQLMTVTVDSYWMVILLRYGAPILLLHALLITLVLRASLKNHKHNKSKSERPLIQAWFFTATCLSLVACTVHFWGPTVSIFFIVLGVCSMGTSQRSARKKKTLRTKPNAKLFFGNPRRPLHSNTIKTEQKKITK